MRSAPSNKLVNTQSANSAAFYSAAFYSDADIETWYQANISKITRVGSMFLINGTTSGNRFADVVDGINGSSPQLEHSLPSIADDRKTITDGGKEILIGTTAEPRLLVLRRALRYGSQATGGASNLASDVGYVITENNSLELNGNIGRFTVRFARV